MSKNIVFFLAFLLAAGVFLAHWWVVGSAVWGDGRFYYSYARSLGVDMVVNKYSIGPAIFWLPGFLIAHLLVRGVGFLPQILVWKYIYGEFASPYFLGGEKFNWQNPQIQKNRLLSLAGIFLFLAQTYLISSWHIWWGGAAYWGRMFVSLMPFFPWD